MAEPGWARRLDERVDEVLKRRFGFGLIGDPEPSLRRQVLFVFLISVGPALVLLIVLVAGGKGSDAGIVVGPLVGVTLAPVLGRVIRDRRRRR